MASSSPSAAICGICSELFDDPGMLNCLHSFCCKCLKTKGGRGSVTSVTCPTCEKTTPIESGGIDAFLKDLRMSYESKVAQYTKKVQSKEEKSCDQCVDVSNGPAVSLCMKCRKFLCELCCKYHKISQDTLNHELQPVDSIDLKTLKVPYQPMNCQIHTDEILKFYCENCMQCTHLSWLQRSLSQRAQRRSRRADG